MSELVNYSEEENVVYERLSGLGLSSQTYTHAQAFTVDEQTTAIGHLAGSMTKNLFLRDKKHGLFLVTAGFNQKVDMKALGTMLKLSGSNLRFGDEDLLMSSLGVIKGSVSPFAMMNDTEHKVKFCVDKNLMTAELINVHPLRNDRTTSITPSDLTTFLQSCEVEMIVLDFDAVPAPAPAPAPAKGAKKQGKEGGGKEKDKQNKTKPPAKGTTGLDIAVTKDGDFAKWYIEVIKKAELIDYSDISGCYILRPWSYFMWERIQMWFDKEIKKLGVKNGYFPLFVSKSALETEKDHIEGFAPEVAWVTKSGESDLQEHIAIRPTSETIMYPFFAKWIRSHRDLPFKINQWANVVRWEFKDATPFLRSREFLWQEGHTAHITNEEADEMVMAILDLYRRVYEELLAVPVIPGRKTESEKFAGGDMTTTVEAYINGSGRAIQGATSHNLGQNFGKMFKIHYESESGTSGHIPWQTSWGLTTRSIGVGVMVHGDDKGLIIPPRVSPVQAIIVPISSSAIDKEEQKAYCKRIESILLATMCGTDEDVLNDPIRAEIDLRDNYTPGWKYNHWEQKGVPVRIEVGPRDMANEQCRIVRRDNGEKIDMPIKDIGEQMPILLKTIQNDMFIKAKTGRDEKIATVYKWEDFVPALEEMCLVMTPFCDEEEWEDKVKAMSRDQAGGAEEAETTATSVAAKTLCKPFDQPELPEGTPCFVSGKPATTWVLWGRSY